MAVDTMQGDFGELYRQPKGYHEFNNYFKL